MAIRGQTKPNPTKDKSSSQTKPVTGGSVSSSLFAGQRTGGGGGQQFTVVESGGQRIVTSAPTEEVIQTLKSGGSVSGTTQTGGTAIFSGSEAERQAVIQQTGAKDLSRSQVVSQAIQQRQDPDIAISDQREVQSRISKEEQLGRFKQLYSETKGKVLTTLGIYRPGSYTFVEEKRSKGFALTPEERRTELIGTGLISVASGFVIGKGLSLLGRVLPTAAKVIGYAGTAASVPSIYKAGKEDPLKTGVSLAGFGIGGGLASITSKVGVKSIVPTRFKETFNVETTKIKAAPKVSDKLDIIAFTTSLKKSIVETPTSPKTSYFDVGSVARVQNLRTQKSVDVMVRGTLASRKTNLATGGEILKGQFYTALAKTPKQFSTTNQLTFQTRLSKVFSREELASRFVAVKSSLGKSQFGVSLSKKPTSIRLDIANLISRSKSNALYYSSGVIKLTDKQFKFKGQAKVKQVSTVVDLTKQTSGLPAEPTASGLVQQQKTTKGFKLELPKQVFKDVLKVASRELKTPPQRPKITKEKDIFQTTGIKNIAITKEVKPTFALASYQRTPEDITFQQRNLQQPTTRTSFKDFTKQSFKLAQIISLKQFQLQTQRQSISEKERTGQIEIPRAAQLFSTKSITSQAQLPRAAQLFRATERTGIPKGFGRPDFPFDTTSLFPNLPSTYREKQFSFGTTSKPRKGYQPSLVALEFKIFGKTPKEIAYGEVRPRSAKFERRALKDFFRIKL